MLALIDTNIVLDALQKREPFYSTSNDVMLATANGMFDACVSSSCVTDIYYLLHKTNHDSKLSKQILSNLFEFVTIIDTNDSDCKLALASKIKDYEDAIISQAAYRNNVDIIVTRNKKDFKNSKVQAILPEELLNNLL